MGWWLLRLSAKILALLRLSVIFFSVTVNKKLKINFFCFKELIFVKKQKQTRKRATKAGGHSFITEMATFTLETEYSWEMGYPFDNSRQVIRLNLKLWNGFNFEWTIRLTLSVNFDGQFEDGLSVSNSLYTANPLPSEKIGEGVSVGEGATVHRLVSDV